MIILFDIVLLYQKASEPPKRHPIDVSLMHKKFSTIPYYCFGIVRKACRQSCLYAAIVHRSFRGGQMSSVTSDVVSMDFHFEPGIFEKDSSHFRCSV